MRRLHSKRRSALLLLLAVGCSRPNSCCEGEDEGEVQPLSDQSIYQLDHSFLDQNNVACRLSRFRGSPTLVAMIFTNCSYACPAIVNDIKRVVVEASDPNLKVLLVSMDTKRDPPAVLLQFAQNRGLDERYTLLHGDADAIAEVAAVLGVRYSEVDGGDFSHSNQIALLNREGEVHYRLQGLGVDVAPLVTAIHGLH